MSSPVSISDLEGARARIAPHLPPTPLVRSGALGDACGCELWLKLECRQQTGSFKARGALYKLLALDAAARARGIVTASAGNHALGVANAVQILGLDGARVFVPRHAERAKIAKLRRFPVGVELVGENFEDAQQAALAHARASGATFVSAYDDPEIVAGQGTVGLEILDQLDRFDVVVVPVGGGALSAGIAVAVKHGRPQARVVGVNPEASPSALRSFEQGRALDPFEHAPTLAHGLAGGYGRVPFAVARGRIDEIALVSENELRAAMAALIDAEQVLAEPSGAAGLGAVLAGRIGGLRGRSVVVVISGGNVDAATLRQVLD